MKQQTENGFTLTEIAVVLVGVALLIGGVLQATSMIRNSQLVRTISDIQSVKLITAQFEEKYGYMPGDINAIDVIPGCETGNTNFCNGGDENTVVGGVRGTDDTWWTSDVTDRDETIQFWKHLALAGYLTSINGAADPAGDLGWGETHPGAPIGGGFEFYYDPLTTIGFAGHILRLTSNGIDPAGGMNGALTPAQAGEVDRKIDDGRAGAGKVFADYGVNDNACKTFEVYDESDPDATCILYVVLFR